VLLSWVGPTYSRATQSEEIRLYEAEILVYFLPDAMKTRAEGMEISWELQDSDQFNQRDFYVFWVFNSTRQNAGSVTIGYFAVNKHTAEIWYLGTTNQVKSKEIETIQKLFHKGHKIDQQTILKYGHLSPNVPR
jgi:hypothetical protein